MKAGSPQEAPAVVQMRGNGGPGKQKADGEERRD